MARLESIFQGNEKGARTWRRQPDRIGRLSLSHPMPPRTAMGHSGQPFLSKPGSSKSHAWTCAFFLRRCPGRMGEERAENSKPPSLRLPSENGELRHGARCQVCSADMCQNRRSGHQINSLVAASLAEASAVSPWVGMRAFKRPRGRFASGHAAQDGEVDCDVCVLLSRTGQRCMM